MASKKWVVLQVGSSDVMCSACSVGHCLLGTIVREQLRGAILDTPPGCPCPSDEFFQQNGMLLLFKSSFTLSVLTPLRNSMFLRGARSQDNRPKISDTRGSISTTMSPTHRSSTTRRYSENMEAPKLRNFLKVDSSDEENNKAIRKSSFYKRDDDTLILAKIPRYSSTKTPSTRDAQKHYHLQRMTNSSSNSPLTQPDSNGKSSISSSSMTSLPSVSNKPTPINKGNVVENSSSFIVSLLPPLTTNTLGQNNIVDIEAAVNASSPNEVVATTSSSVLMGDSGPSFEAPSHTLMFEDKKSFWRVKRIITYRVFESLSIGAVVIRAYDHTINAVTNVVLLDRSRILAQVQELEDAGANVPISEHERIVSFMVNRIEAEVDKDTQQSKILISKRPSDGYSSLSFEENQVPLHSGNIGLAVLWPPS